MPESIPPTILIVDDEPAICDNLAAFLEDEGLLPLVAHSGEEAIQRVTDGLVANVCVMDLRLPGMTGTETILAIRRLAPQTRFLVHTGSANDKVIAELARTGLKDVPVFHKPVRDMTQLAEAINSMATAG
jgi:CheY-like chemotaxis protein